MSEPALRKYLERYAEPEAAFARELGHQYAAALVVPLHAEDDSFVAHIAQAAAEAAGRVLVIAVVNATDAAPAPSHTQNERLLRSLTGRLLPRQELSQLSGSPAHAVLGPTEHFDLLLVDRASPGRRLPLGEGVGLARRIGMDIALGLEQLGGVVSPWFGSTDADVQLPPSYFRILADLEPHNPQGGRRVALTWPFWHTPSGDDAIDQATILYELSLRYYTLGLAAAGSPYAYQSLGSAMAVLGAAYAEVRGFPRRQAGEDFYLLDKLAKVGTIHRPDCEPLLLHSRTSERVPFGTGPRVREIIEQGGVLMTYHPRVFELLRLTLGAFRRAVALRDENLLVAELTRSIDAGSVGAVSSALDDLQAFDAVRDMLGASSDSRVRQRRLATWFDALRTLRFIHLLETRAALARLPLLDALALADFCPWAHAGLELNTARIRASEAEGRLPPDIGAESAFLGAVNGR